jgi:hypothetical protein
MKKLNTEQADRLQLWSLFNAFIHSTELYLSNPLTYSGQKSTDLPRSRTYIRKAWSVLIQKILINIPNKKHDIAHEAKENPPDKTAK